jgi:nucleoside-diphosphate-sugar epimerase
MVFFITGASGFIGSYLLKEILINKNNKIYALSRNKNKKLLKKNSSVEWVYGNLRDNFNKYLKKTDILIHLATKYDCNRPTKIYNTNLFDSLLLFERARKLGVKFFFAAGSGFEHGNSKKYISPLSDLKPTTDYQISKALFNVAICNWAKKHKLNLTYMKIFQVYGKREKKNRLYPQILDCSKKNKVLKISKYSRDILRDFISVEDVVKDIIYQVNNNKGVNVSNSCTGKKMSVLKFSNLIWKKFRNSKPKIKSELPGKVNPIKNFGIKKSINIDKISYTFNKLKY